MCPEPFYQGTAKTKRALIYFVAIVMKNEEQEKEIERLNKRINEYACAWRRQQGIISSLSDALQAQEGITLNNLKDRFTSDGNLNQIHPEELEDYIYKAMK